MAVNISEGAIAKITCGKVDFKPVLQVLDIRSVVSGQSANERYRMILSDGVHLQQAMLTMQMNHAVKSGKLQKGSIICMTEFVCNLIQNRKIIIVMALEILGEKCDIIGDPRPFVDPDISAVASHGRSPTLQPSTVQHGGPGISAGNEQCASSPATVSSYGQSVCAGVSATGGSPTNTTVRGGSFGSGSNSVRTVPNGLPSYAKPENGSGYNQHQNLTGYNLSPSTGQVGGSRLSNVYTPQAQSNINHPPPLYINRGPIAKNEAPARIVPIAALNPYQGRWTIKARVTAKSDIRRYNNPRGEGKVFSFDLIDSDGGEIRITCFNLVADQFFDQIEAGKIYLISKGSLKPAQRSFNHLNNEWEIFLESASTIQPCMEEDISIPRQRFDFRPICDMENMETNSLVDVIGVVSSINPSSTIMRKNGTETSKRSLHLRDMSGRSVELTLWGNLCNIEGQQLQQMCDSGIFPILAIKACRVNEFNGKTLTSVGSSQLFINPDFEEAHRLREWFERDGKNTSSLPISRETAAIGRTDVRKSVSQIKDEGLGRSEKPDWITIKASVSFIRSENFCYTACPLPIGERQCSKKVNNNGDGTWHCERCDRSVPQCEYRYLLQLQIQDYTGITWVTAFQECGEEIMGIPAKDLYLLKYEEQDDAKFSEILRRVLFSQYLFKLKVKEENVNDEQRVKLTVVRAEKVDFSQESRFLLDLIAKPFAEDSSKFSSGQSVHDGGQGNMGFGQVPHFMGNSGVSVAAFDRHHLSGQMGQFAMMQRPANAGMYLSCSRCGSAGHTSQNCLSGTGRQGEQMARGNYGNKSPYSNSDGMSVAGKCFKCNQSGHWARDCPGSSGFQSTYSGRPGSDIYGSRMGGY